MSNPFFVVFTANDADYLFAGNDVASPQELPDSLLRDVVVVSVKPAPLDSQHLGHVVEVLLRIRHAHEVTLLVDVRDEDPVSGKDDEVCGRPFHARICY